jgi:hypothetical protein
MSEIDDVHRIMRRIQREAGLDPDGPPRAMRPSLPRREDIRRELRRQSEVEYRDAMLRRALRFSR